MSTQPQTFLTPEQYLELENQAERRSEYLNGEIFLMAGATPRHVRVTTNIVIAAGLRLRGGSCQVYSTDLRLCVNETGLYTYPDVLIVCGQPRFDGLDPNSLVNPTVIFEVLSPSTQDYDRGRKFTHYRSLSSLKEYVIVAQESVRVEKYARQPDGSWLFTETADPEAEIRLDSIDCELPLSEVYSNVSFGD